MISQPRIHITGASGTGTSTLGAALAERLAVPQFDVDDFYWVPTDPPFSQKRAVPERLQLLEAAIAGRGWLLSGSLVGWGEPLLRDVDLIVFLQVPTVVRLARLRARERSRYGDAILPGGKMEHIHIAFMEWAAQYDHPSFSGRSLAAHDAWLNRQTAPVLRIDGLLPTGRQIERVLREWQGPSDLPEA
ncbi:MAG: AAA family ATPase [Mesorhizobium sp.]|nr:AAA family ATPase [Mesorhizobium sp.]MCO5162964.1 AAA family ATPase [Mesorhizobium sp.]